MYSHKISLEFAFSIIKGRAESYIFMCWLRIFITIFYLPQLHVEKCTKRTLPSEIYVQDSNLIVICIPILPKSSTSFRNMIKSRLAIPSEPDINWNKHVRAFTVAEILLHHMVAENYYWLAQIWILCLLLLKHNIVILVEPSVWQTLDCTCTLVKNGHVFEQLVHFYCWGWWGGKNGETILLLFILSVFW